MKPPLYVRPLTHEERTQLEAERRGANAFRVRRAQIVLASARGLSPKPIAQLVGCAVQTVRNVIHAFNTKGLECLAKQSNRPKSVAPTWTLPTVSVYSISCISRRAPMASPPGVWTLALAAQVCYEQGVTERCLSEETIRRALKRLRHQLEAGQTLDHES